MINRRFTLIYANMGTVEAAILDCYKTDVKILKVQNTPLEIQLEKSIPYYTKVKEIVLWQPKNASGTVLFGNQYDGFDVLGHILRNQYKLELTRIAISCNIESEEDDYAPFYKFEHLYADGRNRYVRVMWDNHWDFYENGEPMPFEQTEKYQQKIRSKRLTNDMVLDYAKALGWDLRDPCFWESDKNAWYITYEFV